MQLSSLFTAAAVLAVASAKVAFQNPTFAIITAGKPFELDWVDATGPVSIILRGKQPGSTVTDPNNLAVLQTITSGQTGTSFVWNVPATIVHDTYALEITDGKDENYSTLFEVIGGVVASTSGSASRTTSVSGSQTASQTSASSSSGSASSQATSSASESLTTSTRTSSSTTRASTAAASTSPTAPPAGGMAAGLTSNMALVFVVVGALFMLN